MGRPFDTSDGIAAAELAFYSCALLCSLWLCARHGFTREGGWRALLILSLARILGGSFRLATLADPENIRLYIGWQTLNGIGLAPLTSLILGLMARVFLAMEAPLFKSWFQRVVDLVLLVAIVLLIVGGSTSSWTMDGGQLKIHYSTASHVAVALLIALLATVLLEILIALSHLRAVPRGEHRIIYVVALCLPVVAVRLAYSCLLVYAGTTSSPWLYLGISSLPEMIVSVICILLGFTLPVRAKEPVDSDPKQSRRQRRSVAQYNEEDL